jgi:hypothetical protein
VAGPNRQLTGWSLGEARKTRGVEVGVMVGKSKLTNVSKGTGVGAGLLDVGVSSIGVGVEAGISVVWEVGRLQDDTPMMAAIRALQMRFLIVSSFSNKS